MSEIFKHAAVEKPVETSASTSAEPVNKEFVATKEGTAVELEYKDNLDVWETESKKKFCNEYFDTHNIGDEFSIKMPLSKIDKFIKAELNARGEENTTENYRKILQEIEKEIDSGHMTLDERLKKITVYIGVLKRIREAKEKLGALKSNVRLD